MLDGVSDELRVIFATQAGHAPVAPLDDAAKRLFVPAPNVIQFITRRDYMNAPSLYKYARSYQVLRDYFELRCPICNKGGNGPGDAGDCMPNNVPRTRMYLESEVLLVWKDEYDDYACDKCGITKSELIEDKLLYGYNSFHLVVGQRAGKTVTASYAGCFVEHMTYCIAHTRGGLWRYFGMEPGDNYEITYLAASEVQSKRTIWAKYTGYRKNSPWFKQYVGWVKEQQKRQPRSGMLRWAYAEGATSITNDHPAVRLTINSLNSNSNAQAGATRLMAVADELARMKQTDGAQGAAEIYGTLMASLRTIKSRTRQLGLPSYFGTMASITSPIRKDDVAMKLLKQSASLPTMYAGRYATWEYNPFEPESGFKEDFVRDPVMAARNFGAQPAGAEHPLIADEASWAHAALDQTLKPTVDFELYTRTGKKGHKYIAARVKKAAMALDQRPRFFAFDAGKNFDAFTGAGGYPELRVDADGKDHITTVVEWVMRIVPPQGYEVWYDSVVDIIQALVPNVPFFARGEFDHWQSTQLVQQVRELGDGIEAEEVYTHPDEYTRWRVDCFAGRFRMPWPLAGKDFDPKQPLFTWVPKPINLSPVGAVVYELTGLERDPETGKIRNPRKGEARGANSDDAAQVVIRLHNLIQKFGYTKSYYDRSRTARAHRGTEGNRMAPVTARRAAAVSRSVGTRGW